MSVNYSIPAFHELTEHGKQIVTWYSERARSEGWLAGYDHAMLELGLLVDDDRAGANLKALALLPSHADLLERRGQHQAADEYRTLLRDRGVAS